MPARTQNCTSRCGPATPRKCCFVQVLPNPQLLQSSHLLSQDGPWVWGEGVLSLCDWALWGRCSLPTTSCALTVLMCPCELTAAVVAYTGPTQDQASQCSSMEWEGVHEAQPLTGKFWVIHSSWKRETLLRVWLLFGWPHSSVWSQT